ncbi:MAG: radical SAM protein [Candidatus Thermoplasmatota archaeon]|nr:radical SAM protein [Candidatus Thermoplasmatota archaeon]
MIIRESKLQKGLPKETLSLCPDCKQLIKARIFEEDGKVMIDKTCERHGYFKDVYWSDVELYLRAEKFAYDGFCVSNPRIKAKKECPYECGLCNLHLSHTVLANIDLTNRCNLACPICFANAATAGYIYEPSYKQVVEMLKMLRSNKPVPCPSVQFSGGEPTLHPHFFDIIKAAKELGFSQVQVATNGLKLLDLEFCQRMKDCGLSTVYLQFDGLRDEIYRQARGKELLDIKLKVIENCNKVKPKPLSTVLVPTIVNGINDNEVGEILKFAIEHSDVIRGVNYQPVSFSGRIDQKERESQRFTLPDLVNKLVEQTDFLTKEDFYPVPVVAPISELISILAGEPKVAFTPHPHCGLATFLYIEDGRAMPITRFINVEGLFAKMLALSNKLAKIAPLVQFFSKLKSEKGKVKSLEKNFRKYFGEFIYEDKMPKTLNLLDFLTNLFSEQSRESLGRFTWKTLMVGGMHFQDDYNYDVERVKRCVIHYATPNGRIIPFCAYNGGITYREEVEKKFSMSLEEWKKREKV